jgi:hypothetical protein
MLALALVFMSGRSLDALLGSSVALVQGGGARRASATCEFAMMLALGPMRVGDALLGGFVAPVVVGRSGTATSLLTLVVVSLGGLVRCAGFRNRVTSIHGAGGRATVVLAFAAVVGGLTIRLAHVGFFVALVVGVAVRDEDVINRHDDTVRSVFLKIDTSVVNHIFLSRYTAVRFVLHGNINLGHLVKGCKRHVVMEIFLVIVAAYDVVSHQLIELFDVCLRNRC